MSGLRKVALLACITSAFSFLWGTWNLIQQIQHAQAAPPALVALSVASTLAGALTPVFYFALFRNEALLPFGAEQRKVSLVAAIVFGILVAISLPAVLESLSSYVSEVRTFGFQAGPGTTNVLVSLVGEVSNISYAGLLIALYHAPEIDQTTTCVPDALLEVVSRLLVVLSGLRLAYVIVETAAVPCLFWSNRIPRFGQEPHFFQYMIDGPLTKLLIAACLFAAPYVVAMSIRSARGLLRSGIQIDPLPGQLT